MNYFLEKIESMGALMAIPGVVVLYGVSTFACKWLCGKHIHQLFFSAVDADKAFVNYILDECAKVIAQDSGQKTDVIKPRLRDLFEGKTDPPELASLIRVDYEIEKTTPSNAHVWLHLLFKNNGSVKKKTLEYDVEWAWLPALVREKFIRENPDKQTYIFIAREEAGYGAGTASSDFHGETQGE